ncbi:MAG: glycosyltransferase family 4 protein [Chloroflexota bacterium]
MHILLVTHYYEPESGAAAVRLTRLAKLLHQNGHQVTILTTMPHYPTGIIADEYKGKWSIDEMRDGIRVIQVWLWTSQAKSISKRLISQLSFMVTSILRGITLPQPDVVFIENQPMFTGFAGRFIADIKRIPYVLNVSDLWPDHLLAVGALTETSLIYRIARRMVDAGYRGAEHIVVLSSGFERIIAEQQPKVADKIQTRINGVDLKQFRPMNQTEVMPFYKKYKLDPHKKWITFMGTFATQYDFELMLDVAQHFQPEEWVGFLFVGTGSQENLVATRITQGKLSNVHRIEWVTHDEMPLAWNVSTVTYWAMQDAPLLQTIIPAKLFELLACGIPMVATQESISSDMINDAGAGITLAPHDLAGTISAIEQLLADDDLRQSMRDSARAYAIEHLDQYKVAKVYEDVLQSATKKYS